MPTYCQAAINHVDGTSRVAVEVAIGDGRAEPLSWGENGFELRSVPSAVRRWNDPAEVAARHHPEVIELVTAEVGCDAVLFYPPIVRDPVAASSHPDLGPVEAAHSDYTEDYRTMLATDGHPYLDVLAPSMRTAGVSPADIAGAGRLLTLQFWRNIGPRRPDRPIAFCDSNTVARDELTPYLLESYGGAPARFESFLLDPPRADRTAGPRRWFTFPAMQADEVVMFRGFDSDRMTRGEPFWTPHSAFVDPTVGPDAPSRASVEVRAICLFNRS